MRRRKKNPSTTTLVLVGGGLVAVAGAIALFAHRAHTDENEALAAGVAAGADAVGGILAIVDTQDPAPAGDLAIRSGASDEAPIIGGAEKGGTVIVLDGNASADFAKVQWDGGPRRPAATGFAHKSALSLV